MSELEDPAFAPTIGSDPAQAETLATAPRDATVALKIGERLGDRYVVRAFLGEGGMGAVYRALDETLGEEVALKVVRGALGTSTQLRDEVRIAQQVTHRNVCRTYDLEDVGGFHVVKMELVDGESLAQLLAREGKLPIDRALVIARAIATGLDAAHTRSIVHRDLKPGNVMIAGDRVVLMDFGLAQREGEADIAGTPGYMAPEQLSGGAIDARADLYALGCVLYEMLAGERVFSIAGPALAIAHLKTPPPDVRSKRPDAPRWLGGVVAQLLAKDVAPRTAGVKRLATGPRRWPIPVAVLAAIAVATTGLAIAMRSPTWRPDIRAIEPVLDEDAGGPRISPDGTRLAFWSVRGRETKRYSYVMPIAGGMPVRFSNTEVDMVEWTRDGRALLEMIAGHAFRYPLDGAPRTELAVADGVETCGQDALALNVYDNTGFRVAVQLDGQPARDLYQAPAEEIIPFVRCDATGQQILFMRSLTFASAVQGDLWIVDRAGHARQLTTGRTSGTASFTPDGSVVATMRHGDDIELYEIAAAGGEPHQLTFGDGPNVEPEVSPDGHLLVFNRKTSASTIAIGGPGEVTELPSQLGTLAYLTASKRGDVAVAQRTTSAGDEVVRIRLEDGAEETLGSGTMPFLSFDDKRVYFVASDDRHRLLVAPLAGGPTTLAAVFPERIATPGNDGPDGAHVWLDRDHVAEGWHASADGKVASDGVAGLLRPAPSGGWRAVEKAEGSHLRVQFFAPGQPLSGAPSRELLVDSAYNVWLDEHRYGYAIFNNGMHVLDLASGQDVSLGGADYAWAFSLVASDGRHWYSLQSHGHAARRVLANFADRPWR